MHSSLIAVVLCICTTVTTAAGAQCLSTAAASPLHDGTQATANIVKVSAVATPAAKTGGGELIKAAAAGTRDEPGAPRGSSSMTSMSRTQSHPQGNDEQPRRGGTAMLLAALALMSGIALRRYSSNT